MGAYLWRPGEGIRIPGSGVTDVWEVWDMGSKNWAQGRWRSSKHCQLLSHLSCPSSFSWYLGTRCEGLWVRWELNGGLLVWFQRISGFLLRLINSLHSAQLASWLACSHWKKDHGFDSLLFHSGLVIPLCSLTKDFASNWELTTLPIHVLVMGGGKYWEFERIGWEKSIYDSKHLYMHASRAPGP